MTPASVPGTDADRTRRARLAAVLPLLVLAIGLTVLSLGRTTEVTNEYDRYPELAEGLLQGKVAFDRFHPFGYPLLIAAMMTVTRTGGLVAGCLVSSLAAIGFCWAVGRLAERMRPGAALAARWCAVANGLLWSAGTTAASDLTAVAATTMASAVLAVPRALWTWRRLCGAGALLGLGMATRHPAAPVVAVIVAWAVWQRPRPGTAVALLAGWLIGWLPQGVLNAIATGSPFYNEAWHATYLKVCCGDEIEQLQAVYDQGSLPTLTDFLVHSGGRVLAMGLDDLRHAVSTGLSGVVLGIEEVPAWAAWWPFPLALLLLLVLARERRVAWLVALQTLAVTVFVSLAFHSWPRHLLTALPVAVLGPALGAAALMDRFRAGVAVLMALLALLGTLGLGNLRRHLDGEPACEVALARALPDRLQRPIAVLATYRLLDRYVKYPCWSLNTQRLGDGTGPWPDLRERMQRCGADVLLAGRRTSPHVFAVVTGSVPPSDFRMVYQDEDVCALELALPAPDWIVRFIAEPAVARAGFECSLELQLAVAADLAQIASVGAALRPPAGEQQLLDLPSAGPRRHRRAFTPSMPGTWVVQPVLLLRDGRILRGTAMDLVVAP
jgi:hypothetical protein